MRGGGSWLLKHSLGLEEAHEFGSGVGQASATTGNDVQVAGDIEFFDFYFFQPAVLDFPGNTHARHDGDAHAHLNETLDAFNSGHFHRHVERRAMASEKFDDAAAKRRFDDVGDEGFLAEFFDADFATLGEGMLRRDDKGEFVFEDFGGLQLGVAGDERDRAEIETVVDDFVGDVAGKHSVQTDLHAGMRFAEFGERRKQGMDGAFVDAEGEFTALEALKLHEPFLDLIAEVEEALGVFAQQGAGVGQADRAGTADEERLAEGFFEFADGKANGGLGAVKTLGGTGKAAFASDGEKDLQFAKIHRNRPQFGSPNNAPRILLG